MAELTPMKRQYYEIKQQYQDCLLFFRLGDFYEMFDDDARLASKLLDLALTTRDRSVENPDERTPMCGIPYHSAETYIARLIAKGYKVAICEQTEDPALAKGLVQRDVIRIITPGTVTESSMLDEHRSNYISAVYLNNGHAGVSFCDVSTGEFCCAGFDGDAVSHVINELGRFTPREVVLSMGAEENSAITEFVSSKLGAMPEHGGDKFEYLQAAELVCRQFGFEDVDKAGLGGESAAVCAVGALLMLVNEVQQDGSIDKDEGDLLKNAIGFSEQEAQDILIHRVDLAALPVDATKEEVADLFTQTKYSRLLIYREDIDHIIGTIHQKDFYVGCGVTDKPLEEILSPVMFVLENEPISLLLKKLQLAKTQMAVVVDEYGGTCGIVTMEDILEELVGEIWDEHDEEEVFIRKVDKDTYLVDAAMDFDDFAEFFHLNEETEMTSVSGWVMEQFGRVPEAGDCFSRDGLEVRVTRAERHRVSEIQLRREAQTPAPV